jgi:DNA-binding CsgD family transcriptional regulator
MNDRLDGPNSRYAAKATWEISPYVVFGLVGFTLYLTWMFMLYASPAIAPEHFYATITNGAVTNASDYFRFAQLAPLCLTLFVAWQCSDALSTTRGIILLIILSLTMSLLAFAMIALLNSLIVLLYLAWVLMGISQATIILLWSIFLATIGKNRILFFSAICVGSAAALYLLMLLLRPEAAFWITSTLSWFSVLLFTFVHYRHEHTASPLRVKAVTSDSRITISLKSAWSVFIYCTGVGFSICLIIGQNPVAIGALVVGGAVLLAAALVMLDTLRLHRLSESLLIKLHLPALIVGIGPLFFHSFMGFSLLAGIFLLFLMVMFILNLSALSEHVRINHLSPIRVFGYGRLFNALGFTLGALFYYLAFEASYGEAPFQEWVLNIVLLTIIVLFVIGSSFVFEDHYPVPEEQGIRPKIRDAEHPLPSNDPKALLSFEAEDDDDSSALRVGAWKRRCMQLAKDYELSPKETEVLMLLAKGRNAEYIQNELVVSRHTAKAHIYHIYQKTNIHSRQELINLLESTSFDD